MAKTWYEEEIDALKARVAALEQQLTVVCQVCGDKAETYIKNKPFCTRCASIKRGKDVAY